MPQIIATPADPQANSYATVAMAAAYFDEHPLYALWAGPLADKQRALLYATKIIDTYRFFGDVYDSGRQALKWPRTGYGDVFSGVVNAKSGAVLTIQQLADQDQYPADYWEYAGVRMLTGAAKNEYRLVTAYNFKTGQLTLESDFLGAVLPKDQLEIVSKIPDPIRYACCEIAFAYLNQQDPLDFDPRVQSYTVGNVSETFGGQGSGGFVIPPKAWAYLSKYVRITGGYVI